jgi:hypothetical protein
LIVAAAGLLNRAAVHLHPAGQGSVKQGGGGGAGGCGRTGIVVHPRGPSTTLPEPVSACTSAGPSAPYSPASAHTANTTRPPTLTWGRCHSRKETVMSPEITSSRSSRLKFIGRC